MGGLGIVGALMNRILLWGLLLRIIVQYAPKLSLLRPLHYVLDDHGATCERSVKGRTAPGRDLNPKPATPNPYRSMYLYSRYPGLKVPI